MSYPPPPYSTPTPTSGAYPIFTFDPLSDGSLRIHSLHHDSSSICLANPGTYPLTPPGYFPGEVVLPLIMIQQCWQHAVAVGADLYVHGPDFPQQGYAANPSCWRWSPKVLYSLYQRHMVEGVDVDGHKPQYKVVNDMIAC